MKKKSIICHIAAAMLLGSLPAMAVPARPGLRTLTLADGSKIQGRLAGDEFAHQYYSEDGRPLREVEEGIFAFEDISVTDAAARALRNSKQSRLRQRSMRATASEARKTRRAEGSLDGPPFPKGPGLFPGDVFPAYGKQKAIVILVDFPDRSFRTSDPHDYFSRMLMEENFSDLGATGSARQYFELCSSGAFQPEFDVYGPITMKQNHTYYGKNNAYGDDMHPEEMVKEACDFLDDTVDFSEYDRDGNGLIDNVFVFYAGTGEATSNMANDIWPHAFDVRDAGLKDVRYDGVLLGPYGCTNEWTGSRVDGVGTFIHEFSHVIGLPDLYPTNYGANVFSPGSWSCLDYGPYNNDGMTPPLYGAFERYALGWVQPRETTHAANARLLPIKENECGIIRSGKDNEFFLIENRQEESWDKYIPSHGMLLWHIDYNDDVWSFNEVNNNAAHQYVDIEEANGRKYEGAGNTFPGSGKVTSITGETDPGFVTWTKQKLDCRIEEIAEDEFGEITFKLNGGRTEEIPAATAPETVSADDYTIEVSWEGQDGYDTELTVYTREASTRADGEDEGEIVYVPGYKGRRMGDATKAKIENLNPGTKYYFKVARTNNWENGAESAELAAETTNIWSGVDAIGVEKVANIILNGLTAEAAGQQIEVYDTTGRKVAEGRDRVILPGAGLYILRLPSNGRTLKAAVR